MRAAGLAFLDRVGPMILISHSMGGTHSCLWGDARPELVKAIVVVEPSGPPWRNSASEGPAAKRYGLTHVPLQYRPPVEDSEEIPLESQPHQNDGGKSYCLQPEPARKLADLSKMPVLLVTAEASFHATFDDVTVLFLKQAGVDVKHLYLPKEGMRGNGHLLFLEKNNLGDYCLARKMDKGHHRLGL